MVKNPLLSMLGPLYCNSFRRVLQSLFSASLFRAGDAFLLGSEFSGSPFGAANARILASRRFAFVLCMTARERFQFYSSPSSHPILILSRETAGKASCTWYHTLRRYFGVKWSGWCLHFN